MKTDRELCYVRLELGSASKAALDRLRFSCVPTLPFTTVSGSSIPESWQRPKDSSPNVRKRERTWKKSFSGGDPFPPQSSRSRQAGTRQSQGQARSTARGDPPGVGEGRLLMKRTFSQGRFDGLSLPIETGDYGLSEAREGAGM